MRGGGEDGLDGGRGGVSVACGERRVGSEHIRHEEGTVGCIPGAGLKTVEAVVDEMDEPLHIPPDAGAFDEAMIARQQASVAAPTGGA